MAAQKKAAKAAPQSKKVKEENLDLLLIELLGVQYECTPLMFKHLEEYFAENVKRRNLIEVE